MADLDFRRAVALLTVLPVQPNWEAERPAGRAMAWYPAVGLLLGLLLWLTRQWLAGTPPLLQAALIVVAWAGLTGGLHLDGLADCGDALLASVDRQRRLEILRDPRLGAFGGLALTLLLLVKTAAVAAVPARALLAAPVVARWLLPVAVRTLPAARPEGMAARFAAGLTNRDVAVASLWCLVVCCLLGRVGAACLAGGLVAFGLVLSLARQRLGGITGDVLGALVEVAETLALVAVAVGA